MYVIGKNNVRTVRTWYLDCDLEKSIISKNI